MSRVLIDEASFTARRVSQRFGRLCCGEMDLYLGCQPEEVTGPVFPDGCVGKRCYREASEDDRSRSDETYEV